MSEQLTIDLEDALGLFRQNTRKGAIAALLAIHRFTERQGIEAHLSEPIYATILALDGLDAGIVAPLVLKRQAGNRPKLDPATEVARGLAAAAMEFLIRGKESRDEAAIIVARAVSRWPMKGAANVRAKQVMRWRDDANAGENGVDHSTTFYRAVIEDMSLNELKPIEAANRILEVGPSWVGGT